ncbi:MAG: outer membrane lipoprotein-sorting protein [Deltaproteobacteria bacterium]
MLNHALVLTLLAAPAATTKTAPSAYEIAKRAHEISSVGFGGERFASKMELYDAHGERVAEYQLMTFNREGAKQSDGTTKSLVRFTGPADAKGTALLTHEQKNGQESRWLYMAETRRVKQIGSGSMSASFKGSEVSYEDMTLEALDKYDYRLLGDHRLGKRDTWKVEARPKFADSGYSRTVTYYDKKAGYPLKTEFYDRAGKPLKTMLVKGYQRVKGKWRPSKSQIKNVQTKRKTVVTSGGYQLGIDLPDRMFTVAQLQRQ